MSPADLEILLETLKTRDREGNIKTPKVPEHVIRLLEETCQRTGLDWKLRHVYLIERGGKWRVELSIDGFRMIANNQPEYDGQQGPFWALGPDGPWSDIPPDKTPYAAKVGAVKKSTGNVTWGVAKFVDYNPGGQMWKKHESTMIAKCAEMLALRKAFPAALGGLYGAEEMAQASKASDSAPSSTPSAPSASPAKSKSAKWNAAVAATEADKQPPRLDKTWLQKIQEAGTLDCLKALGLEIQQAGLGFDEKLQLNKTYMERKTVLQSEGTTNE